MASSDVVITQDSQTLPATSSTRILKPRLLSEIASCDVASNSTTARPQTTVKDAPYVALGLNDTMTGIHEPNESIDTQRVSLTVEQFQAFLSAAAADAAES